LPIDIRQKLKLKVGYRMALVLCKRPHHFDEPSHLMMPQNLWKTLKWPVMASITGALIYRNSRDMVFA
jgi:hypothetical protein